MKKKLCPIKQDEGDKTYICSEDDCAWWNYSIEACAVAVMALQTGFTIAKDEG